jgi:predicted nucleic acid-binding Zn ribbon protein
MATQRCFWCGQFLKAERKDKRFCSGACRQRHHRREHRASYLTAVAVSAINELEDLLEQCEDKEAIEHAFQRIALVLETTGYVHGMSQMSFIEEVFTIENQL